MVRPTVNPLYWLICL